MKKPLALAMAAGVLACGMYGCSEYVTPPDNNGGSADLGSISRPEPQSPPSSDAAHFDSLVSSPADVKPAAQFPTAIAVVRIQASGYQAPRCDTWGYGKFSVVTTRDVEIEDPKLMEKWLALPKVLGIVPLNHLLLPENLNSDRDLRTAALSLHADMILIYTFDTKVYTADQALPLSILTLGLAPDNTTRVVTTASAILLDTHTGYLYGTAEATDHDDGLTTSWTTAVALDNARDRTEKAAFKDLAPRIEAMWTGVVKAYPAH
jgi:hypothetical protein